jgi:hypothetical protein
LNIFDPIKETAMTLGSLRRGRIGRMLQESGDFVMRTNDYVTRENVVISGVNLTTGHLLTDPEIAVYPLPEYAKFERVE